MLSISGSVMGFLSGKKALVVGIASNRSIAYGIAQAMRREGAELAFSYANERLRPRVEKFAAEFDSNIVIPCDVAIDDEITGMFDELNKHWDSLDAMVHSVAFADRTYLKPGIFNETPRDTFAQALDISAYSLVAMAHRMKEIMPQGGSILAMTYYGSQKAVPGYNVMGVAKAALEACTRYLAAELGEHGIRVNSVSAGPLKTLSSMAVGGIDEIFKWVEQKAPLRRNITAGEVGKTAVYLLSDLATGVTGENIFVDAGYNIVGL